jgi:hypothetical protein
MATRNTPCYGKFPYAGRLIWLPGWRGNVPSLGHRPGAAHHRAQEARLDRDCARTTARPDSEGSSRSSATRWPTTTTATLIVLNEPATGYRRRRAAAGPGARLPLSPRLSASRESHRTRLRGTSRRSTRRRRPHACFRPGKREGEGAPAGPFAQRRSPALADIIGARRARTAVISSRSVPCRWMLVVPRFEWPSAAG